MRELRKELKRDGPDLRIDLAAPDAPVTITGYPDLVRSLLRNLIQNALAASENRPVSLTVEATQDMAAIVVADRGPEFPPEYRRASFDPFVLGITGTRSSSGLALTIAQRIAELHQGTIEIAERPGGAQVTARLPRTLGTTQM